MSHEHAPIPEYFANPITIEALQFDGTLESVEPFIRSSYAFDANIRTEDRDGKPIRYTKIYLSGSGYIHQANLYEGNWVVRHRPSNAFEVLHPAEFERRYRVAE